MLSKCQKGRGIRGDGYSMISINGQALYEHRYCYEQVYGPIPKGLYIDHLCRNPSCINIQHLEVVTSAENTRRGLRGVLKMRCAKGHPYIGKNVFINNQGKRQCRPCAQKINKKQWEKLKANPEKYKQRYLSRIPYIKKYNAKPEHKQRHAFLQRAYILRQKEKSDS